MNHRLHIPCNPVAASRPRIGRWNAYYEGPYKEFYKEAPAIIRQAWDGSLLDTWLEVVVYVYPKRPKKPTNPFPSPDYDNFAKAVCDAMEKIVYVNDKQIVSGRCVKQYAQPGEDGYSIVEIRELSALEIKTGQIGGAA